jgi:spoIIIJ-associated protein
MGMVMTLNKEFEGKDLDEALHLAATSLGIPEPELDYQIIEQGRPGLFGIGAKSVRIRVMPPVRHLPDDALDQEPDPDPGPQPQDRLSPETVKEVESVVQRMIDLMGLELEVKAEAASSNLTLGLNGPDRKLLRQKDAELLSALQFLLNRMSRRAWPQVGRIQIGTDGQRRRRDDELIELTREVAQQVGSTGKTKRLHQMNSYERRLVHLTIREYEGLGSRSEGNGYLKRVRVFKK